MEQRLIHQKRTACGSMREIHLHLEAETSERYLMGVSPHQETADLEEHLLVCARCREQISQTEAYLAAMGDATGDVRGRRTGEPDTGWQLSKLLAVIATLAGLALLGMLAAWYY